MRKNIISFIILLGSGFILSAQDLTIEYNFGYGSFCMRDFRNFLEDKSFVNSEGVEFRGLKVTDDFPGHWINQVKVGVEITKEHQTGLSFDFLNTAGRKALSDPSGHYDYTLRTKGVRIGEFYRYSPSFLSKGIVQPYVMLTAGVMLNKCKIEESFEVYKTDLNSKYKSDLDGFNLFVEPALGCKIRLHDKIALNLNAGYQLDFMKYLEDKIDEISVTPIWSGLRFQGGVVFYIPLRR